MILGFESFHSGTLLDIAASIAEQTVGLSCAQVNVDVNNIGVTKRDNIRILILRM